MSVEKVHHCVDCGGPILCYLCKERPARYIMANRKTDKRLLVCVSCYQQVWGPELPGVRD